MRSISTAARGNDATLGATVIRPRGDALTRDNPDQLRDVQRVALSILNSMPKLISRPIVKPILMRRVLCAMPAALVLGLVPSASVAQLQVQITGVGSQQFPISIANF